jgi:hypothetical protein
MLLERASANGPLVVIMEDIDWADESTRHLRRFLARALTDGPRDDHHQRGVDALYARRQSGSVPLARGFEGTTPAGRGGVSGRRSRRCCLLVRWLCRRPRVLSDCCGIKVRGTDGRHASHGADLASVLANPRSEDPVNPPASPCLARRGAGQAGRDPS